MTLTPEFNKNWSEAYIRAALEVDVQKMPDRIVAAREAVAGRLRDLEGNSDHHAERHEIEAALASLTRLELESRIWPTVGAASSMTPMNATKPTLSPRRNRRILIVDDQPMILKRVRSILAKEPDFEICGEAYDGAKAIEEAQRLKPDVVILNVSMPVMNGFEAARLIKTKLPGTGIVILSSEADKHFIAEAKKIGASAYVDKTKADDSLVKAIDAAVIGSEFISLV